ncbi:MAG: ComEC/Rec2 family competence protein, partial [Alphaproteobacteria bacterium]|nr:ComEC/Rec2 family competence protein [Alphaproteobacteria bacterium]
MAIFQLCGRATAWLDDRFMEERGRWLLWVPVALACGIGLYFALPEEPPQDWALQAIGATFLPLFFLRRWLWALLPAAFLFFAALGFGVAQWRAEAVAAPVLAKSLLSVRGEAVILDMERVQKGHRLLLGKVTLTGVPVAETPERLRLSVKKSEGLSPGQRIAFRAGLHPPPLPAIPGGYDFARSAWFGQIGAVGYAFGEPEVLAEPAADAWRGALEQLRQAVSLRVTQGMAAPYSGMAISLMTAEQNALPQDIIQNMRASGLAHILSISGLHIGLAIVILFGAVRFGLAAVPALALNYPIKKWAAAAALAGSAFYLGITGFPVPAVRSWLMAAFILLAIIADRAQASMRFVALSAILILLAQPEALLSVSFQLSY